MRIIINFNHLKTLYIFLITLSLSIFFFSTIKVNAKTIREGDYISIDGFDGKVYSGDIPVVASEVIQVMQGNMKEFDAVDPDLIRQKQLKIYLKELDRRRNTDYTKIYPDTIAKFLDKRGPGIHHVCFEVIDINSAIKELKENNINVLSDEPTIGAEGYKVVFIHPKSTGGILVELAEKV